MPIKWSWLSFGCPDEGPTVLPLLSGQQECYIIMKFDLVFNKVVKDKSLKSKVTTDKSSPCDPFHVILH